LFTFVILFLHAIENSNTRASRLLSQSRDIMQIVNITLHWS